MDKIQDTGKCFGILIFELEKIRDESAKFKKSNFTKISNCI